MKYILQYPCCYFSVQKSHTKKLDHLPFLSHEQELIIFRAKIYNWYSDMIMHVDWSFGDDTKNVLYWILVTIYFFSWYFSFSLMSVIFSSNFFCRCVQEFNVILGSCFFALLFWVTLTRNQALYRKTLILCVKVAIGNFKNDLHMYFVIFDLIWQYLFYKMKNSPIYLPTLPCK